MLFLNFQQKIVINEYLVKIAIAVFQTIQKISKGAKREKRNSAV